MSKVRAHVSIEPEHMDWIEKEVDRGRFSSVSHAVRWLIERQLERESEGDDAYTV